MGTGYSRPDKPGYGPNFGGVDNDLAAFGEFIRSFLNEYNLWGSPLFVGGESYGTTRAAGSGRLSHRPRLPHQRRDAPLGDLRHQRRRRRAAPAQHAADRDHDRALSQEARSGPAKAHRRPDGRAGAPVRLGRIPGVSVRRRPRDAGPAGEGAERHGPATPDSRRPSSTPSTCASRSGRSAPSCCATGTS